MKTDALYGPPKVGGDILAACTKCKQDMAHVIVSMVDGKVAKVICKTCRSEHKYRGYGVAPKKTSGLAKPREKVTTVRMAEHWEKKMAEAKRPSRSYRVNETFTQGDVIQHSKFGLGLVEEVKLHGKIIVLFRDGEKTLVHSHSVSAHFPN